MQKGAAAVLAILLAFSVINISSVEAANTAPAGLYNVSTYDFTSLEEFKSVATKEKLQYFNKDWFLLLSGSVISMEAILTASDAQLGQLMVSEQQFKDTHGIDISANGIVYKAGSQQPKNPFNIISID